MKGKVIRFLVLLFMLISSMVFGIDRLSYAETVESRHTMGSEHPINPGDVMLFKEANPVKEKVNTWDITLRVESKDKKIKNDIVLVMDTSNSMIKNNRMLASKKAAKQFINNLLPSDTNRISIVSFGTRAKKDIELTNDKVKLESKIDSLHESGGTFTQEGLKKAEEILSTSNADNKHVVLLSDGEPTYSYEIMNPKKYLVNYNFNGKNILETSDQVPKYAYNYNIQVGNGTSMYTYIVYGLPFYNFYYYYNHGNSAISESRYLKNKNCQVWSIALQAERQGEYVLRKIANEGNYFQADPDSLKSVFSEISGAIVSGVRNATVEDEMGVGFEIPEENIANIKKTQGKITYNNNKLYWNLGSLSKNVEGQNDVKYAELRYTVEINDSILGENPDAEGKYPANRLAKINYKNINDELEEKTFPVPKVNPVFYTVEKVLLDVNGKEISEDKDFSIKINHLDENKELLFNSIILNTKKGKIKSGNKTDLRLAGKYRFFEDLNDKEKNKFETKYYLNGEAVDKAEFNVLDENTKDIHLKVVNKKRLAATQLEPAKCKVLVSKKWEGKEEKSTKVRLYKDGKETKEVLVLDKSNGYKGEFKNLSTVEKIDSEKGIKYTVKEEGSKDGKIDINGNMYEVSIKGDQKSGYEIENKYIPKEREIEFSKVERNKKEELPGASLKIVKGEVEEGKVVHSWTTDKKSKKYILKEGVYSLVEEKAPEGYLKAEKITFRINGNGKLELKKNGSWQELKTGKIKMEDSLKATQLEPAKCKVLVSKKWEGKEEKSTKVRLYKDGKETKEVLVLDKSNGYKGEFKNLSTVEKINSEKGIKYTVKEEGSKDGKIDINGNMYEVSIKGDQKSGYEIENKYIPKEREIEFSKVERNKKEELPGASLKIVKGEVEEGEVVHSWTTDKKSKKHNLKEGVYSLVEEKAPEGYLKAEKITFRINGNGKLELKKNGSWQELKTGKIKMEDSLKATQLEPAKCKVLVSKKWEGKEEKSTKVRLYKDGKETKEVLVLDKSNGYKGEFKNLSTVEKINSEKGIKYTVKEEGSKDGKIDINGNIYEVSIKGDQKSGYEIENKYIPKEREIEFSKVERNKKEELPGASLKIIKGEVEEGKVVHSWTTDKKSKKYILKEGVYSLVEEKAPEGYLKAEKITFRINGNGKLELKKNGSWQELKTGKIKMEDSLKATQLEPAKCKVLVSKKWEGKEEKSTKVRLYKDGKETKEVLVLDKSNGYKGEFKNLSTVEKINSEKGIKYTVKEEGSKDGKIDINGNMYEVSIKGDQKSGYEIENKYIPKEDEHKDKPKESSDEDPIEDEDEDIDVENPITKEIEFSKVETNKNNELVGANLKIVEGEEIGGRLVQKWTTDKKSKKYILKEGVYSLVEEKAPEGYLKAEKITFRINKNGDLERKEGINWKKLDTLKIKMEDKKIINRGGSRGNSRNSGSSINHDVRNSGGTKEKTISVKKEWIGNEEKEVKIRLYEDGKITDKVIELTKENNYKGKFKDLSSDVSKYTVKEENSENNIVKINNNEYRVIIEGNQESGYIIKNKYIPKEKTIEFSKVDLDSRKKLSGANLELLEGSGKYTKLVQNWTTDFESKKYILKEGIYTLIEKSAPKGYLKADNIVFKIDREGKLYILHGENWIEEKNLKIVMEDKKIDLNGSKNDPTNKDNYIKSNKLKNNSSSTSPVKEKYLAKTGMNESIIIKVVGILLLVIGVANYIYTNRHKVRK